MNDNKEIGRSGSGMKNSQKNDLTDQLSLDFVVGSKWIRFILVFMLILIVVFSITNLFRPHLLWGHFEFINYPLHSSMEALGAIAALLMAFMPVQVIFGKVKPSYVFISLGFLQMGLWDIFHSFYQIGNGFVFTHGIAILAGGLLFSLIIFPWKFKFESTKKYLAISGGITTIILAALAAYNRAIFPDMVSNGEFTTTANVMNMAGGILFFLSAVKLTSIYIQTKNLGVLILVFIAVSSGVVGITFQFSEVWTDGWWLWHIIRLIAFLATLSFMLWRIQKVSTDLNLALKNLNQQHLVTAESEKKFKGLFNNDPSAIIIADPITGILVDVNPAAEALMEMSREELLGMHQSKLHPEDVMEEQVENFKQLQNQPNVTVNSEILTKTGIRKFVEIKVSKVEFENKPFILGIFHDISTLVQHQTQLKQSAENSRAVINSLPGLFYQISPEGKFVTWNENFETILGYSSKEMSELSPLDLFEGEEKNRIHANIQKVFTEGYATVEAHLISKSGEKTPFFFTGKLINIDNNPLLIGMGLDISEQKDAEIKLRESELRFRQTFDFSPSGIVMVALDKKFLQINNAFAKMLGYEKEEIAGQSIDDLTFADDKMIGMAQMKAIMNGEMLTSNVQKRYVRKDKQLIWVDVTISLLRDSEGRPKYFIGIVQDITQKKQFQNELILKNIVFESSVSANSTADTNGVLKNVNAAFLKIWGYRSADEVIGKSLAEFIQNEDEAREIINALTNSGYWTGEYTAIKKDGTTFIAQANASILKDADDHFIGYQSSVIDITDKKKAEEERTRFFNLTLDYLCVAGTDGYFKSVNPSWTKTFGFTEQEFLSKPFFEFIHPDDIKPTVNAVAQLSKQNPVVNFINRYRCKNGTYRWLSWAATPQNDTIYAAAHDITDIKEAEEKLTNFNAELENLVRERTADLERNQKLLDETSRLALVGGWEIDLLQNKLSWTKIVYLIHETTPEEFTPTVEAGINFYTPEAIPIISDAVEKAITKGIPFDLELQIITAKKNKIWVRAIGQSYYNNGKIVKVGGVFQDINEKKLIDLELNQHRENLELLVKEKTSDLTDAIDKLERNNKALEIFNKMAVGREKRMIELKRKINALCKESGKTEPYDLSFAEDDSNFNEETLL